MSRSKQESSGEVQRPGPAATARRWLERAAASAGFHYATLLALQTKILWGVFAHRDLTMGDTSSYFRTAEAFSRELTCVIHWSPLYTSYFGSFLWFGDAVFAVTAHRVGIVVLLGWLVYEFFRRLLPRTLAWMLAAWWIVLPTNHETLYEVHLFALAPLLATWLVLLRRDDARARGIAFACLLVITVLMRNEYVLALGAFGLLALGHDLRIDPRRLRLYVGPALVAVLLIGGAYARSTLKYPELSKGITAKHTLNIAQIYAFGYGQRHDEYESNPWIDYDELMEETFGNALPTLWQAIAANPGAMAEHFSWNASLVPSGLQTALLGARAGRKIPGYAATPRKPLLAWLGTLAVLGIWVTGGRQLLGPGRAEFFVHLKRERWAYTAMACVAVTVAVVAILQRPRPAYMFPLTVLLMLYTGHCLRAMAQRWARLAPPAWSAAAAILAVLLVTPSYWADRDGRRPVATYYRALETHRDLFPTAAVGVAVPGWENDLRFYLERGNRLWVVPLPTLIAAETDRPEDVARILADAHVGLVLVDEARIHSEGLRRFWAEAPALGWEPLEEGPGVGSAASGGDGHGALTKSLQTQRQRGYDPSSMPTPQPLLTVLLPLFDPRGDPVERLRVWTEGQTCARDRYQIAMATPGHDPELDARLQALLAPHDRLVHADRPSSDGLYERSFAVASAPFVLLTEMHAVPEPDCVEAIVRFLDAHPATEVAKIRTGHLGASRMARLERLRYRAHLADWDATDHWYKVRLRGCVLQSEMLRKLGGFLPGSGGFADQDISARVHEAGYHYSTIADAEIKHDDGKSAKAQAVDIADFVLGELAVREKRDPDFCERYFGSRLEWNERAFNDPVVASEARRSIARTLASALTSIASWRWAPTLVREWLRHRIGLGPRIAAARALSKFYELKLWLVRGDAALTRGYEASATWMARALRLDWVRRHQRPGRLGAIPTDACVSMENAFADWITGFHDREEHDGECFRWGEPTMLVRLRVPPRAARVMVSLAPLRPRLERLPIGVFWNGRRVESVEVSDRALRFDVDSASFRSGGTMGSSGAPAEQWLLVTCPAIPGSGSKREPRRLALACRSVSIEPRGEAGESA